VLRLHKNEDGAILVTSIIIISVLIIFITALASSLNSNIKVTKRHEDEVKAFYAAEAGIERGINLLLNDKDNVDDLIENDGKYLSVDDDHWNSKEDYRLKFSKNGNEYTINSTGTSNNLNSDITVEVKINNNGPFSNAITSGGNIHFNSEEKGEINGSIYANGKIEDLEENSKLNISGDIYENQEDDIIPDFDDFFIEGHNVWADYDGNKKEFPGNSMEISNSALFDKLKEINGSGILVVKGSLTFKKHVKINKNTDDFLIILAEGPVIFDKQVEGNFFLYSKDSITFNSGSGSSGRIDMKGSLMAEKNIITNVDIDIEQNDDFVDIFTQMGFDIPENGEENNNKQIEFVSWQES
jgi:hypothetical protein